VPGYPPPPGWSPYPSQGTNGFAIAALVLGILWIWWIGAILAIVFGIVALRQLKQRPQGGRGLAIAGIVIGAVELTVVPIIIAVVFAIGTSVKGDFHDTCVAFSPPPGVVETPPC
jgi:hypothetical protein